MSGSSQDPKSTDKLVAVFSSKNRSNQETFSDREDFPFRHQQVFGSNEPFFRFSNPANVAKSLLDGNRDHLLAEAGSELMKQEYKVASLNTCVETVRQDVVAQVLLHVRTNGHSPVYTCGGDTAKAGTRVRDTPEVRSSVSVGCEPGSSTCVRTRTQQK